jgi:ferric-dicitrate binding protein FerR (iron transport regulator)
MSEEQDIERVLRAAGARPNPSAEMRAAVHAAVRVEWQATVQRQQRRRRRVWFAAAAAVAITAIGALSTLSWLSAPRALVASVSRSVGTVNASQGYWHYSVAAHTGQGLHAGQTLTTGSDGRVALRLPAGLSVRLDRNTRVSLIETERIAIHQGAVYVDAGEIPVNPLQIDTPAGSVRHLGTQYEVRLVGNDTRVRVREGRVEVRSNDGIASNAGAGEQLMVSSTGRAQRSSIVTYGNDWSWVSNAAPPFDTNSRPFSEFLAWVGRELGREIVFATPDSEVEASRTVLSGSVPELSPAEALSAVLPTTRLRSYEREGSIVIELESAPR